MGRVQSNSEFWDALDKLVAESEIVIDRPKEIAIPGILSSFIGLIMAT